MLADILAGDVATEEEQEDGEDAGAEALEGAETACSNLLENRESEHHAEQNHHATEHPSLEFIEGVFHIRDFLTGRSLGVVTSTSSTGRYLSLPR